MKTLNIAIIEDHAMIRGLVALVVETHLAPVSVSTAATGREGLALAEQEALDLVILDLELPDADGFDLVEKIRALRPACRVAILSSHTEDYFLHRVAEAKVEGFIDKKDQSPEMLGAALKRVAEGGRYVSPLFEKRLNELRANPNAFHKLLSNREQQLLKLFGLGWSDDRIGEAVELRGITVRNHRRNIMARLGIHSTPELIRYAVENGFSRAQPGE